MIPRNVCQSLIFFLVSLDVFQGKASKVYQKYTKNVSEEELEKFRAKNRAWGEQASAATGHHDYLMDAKQAVKNLVSSSLLPSCKHGCLL